MSTKSQRVIIVGGGLAGLAGAVKCAELGLQVDLFSVVPVKRSHSVCAQGGINACNEIARQQGYSEREHFDESIYGGDFLAHQPPVYEMAHWAPRIIDLFDRMGVPFNRTPEGMRDLRLFGGSLYKRTHFAGATTGQQLIYALDEQARRATADGKVTQWIHWEFLRPIVDADGRCRGIVAQDQRTMQVRAFRADAVAMANGGLGLVFGKSTNSVMCNGAATARCYRAGVTFANSEFVQVHPTAIPGADKLRLMSESARGEGGRVWVPKDPKERRRGRDVPEKERDYFLEQKYPGYGNLVPRDIASRELFLKGFHEGKGVFNPKTGKNELEIYLDVTHLPKEVLRNKLAGVLEIYEKFVGEDPYENPMRIFPAVHYSMGGLWVDFERTSDGKLVMGSPRNQATNIEGLYAAGEVDYQYHGANRLGANSLLSCIYGGLVTGPAIATYVKNLGSSSFDAKSTIFERAAKRERDRYEAILKMGGTENPWRLHAELSDVMLRDCTIERHNDVLAKVIAKIDELEDRWHNVGVPDTSARANQGAQFVRHLKNMLVIARVIAQGAQNRNESRGAHYKPDFKQRDDENWLRTTMAMYREDGKRSRVEYVRSLDYPLLGKTVHVTDAVDVSLVAPRARKYETAGAASAAAGAQKSTDKTAAAP